MHPRWRLLLVITAIRGAQAWAAKDSEFRHFDPQLSRFVRSPRVMILSEPLCNRRLDTCEMIVAGPPRIARCFKSFTISPEGQGIPPSFAKASEMPPRVQICGNKCLGITAWRIALHSAKSHERTNVDSSNHFLLRCDSNAS